MVRYLIYAVFGGLYISWITRKVAESTINEEKKTGTDCICFGIIRRLLFVFGLGIDIPVRVWNGRFKHNHELFFAVARRMFSGIVVEEIIVRQPGGGWGCPQRRAFPNQKKEGRSWRECDIWIVWALIGHSRERVKNFRKNSHDISAHHMAGGWLLLHVVLITTELNFHVFNGHKKVLSFLHMCITITHQPDIMGRWVTWNDYATPRLELLFEYVVNMRWMVAAKTFFCVIVCIYSLVGFRLLEVDVPAWVVFLVWIRLMCILKLQWCSMVW
jgi:hypothetical protein